jgi:hypothetical protein
MEGDGGYAGKVLAEQTRLQAVLSGRPVPLLAPEIETQPVILQGDGPAAVGALNNAQREP